MQVVVVTVSRHGFGNKNDMPDVPFASFPAGILFNDVYAASKFAVEGFCESLAVQALRFNLR